MWLMRYYEVPNKFWMLLAFHHSVVRSLWINRGKIKNSFISLCISWFLSVLNYLWNLHGNAKWLLKSRPSHRQPYLSWCPNVLDRWKIFRSHGLTGHGSQTKQLQQQLQKSPPTIDTANKSCFSISIAIAIEPLNRLDHDQSHNYSASILFCMFSAISSAYWRNVVVLDFIDLNMCAAHDALN